MKKGEKVQETAEQSADLHIDPFNGKWSFATKSAGAFRKNESVQKFTQFRNL